MSEGGKRKKRETGQDDQGLNTFVFSRTKLVLTAAASTSPHTHTQSKSPAMLKINYSSVFEATPHVCVHTRTYTQGRQGQTQT